MDLQDPVACLIGDMIFGIRIDIIRITVAASERGNGPCKMNAFRENEKTETASFCLYGPIISDPAACVNKVSDFPGSCAEALFKPKQPRISAGRVGGHGEASHPAFFVNSLETIPRAY